MVRTYAYVIDRDNMEKNIRERIANNKRIKSISYWRYCPHNNYFKEVIIEFERNKNNYGNNNSNRIK